MIWIFIAVLILPLLALQLVGYWLSGPHYKPVTAQLCITFTLGSYP
jgi:hypothetical protein